ncbi:PHD finger protein 7-like [Culex quinquefasciatus]|uniref:PHD finger protein 7-like n=1 Tax=Culex quinquefasciatus TaxID=7176 RepID=UPI0018E3373D|nr:PHD finger protein 7-like [Culex quinquefasciatus]
MASKAKTGTICFLCKSPEKDESLYRNIVGRGRFIVHLYCLLLTPNLERAGTPGEEGLLGFMLNDILSAEKQLKAQICYLCGKAYANISCQQAECGRTFHMACGRWAACLYHFVHPFPSWCHRHVKHQIVEIARHGDEDSCGICRKEMALFSRLESIRPPCCRDVWFHRRCVAKRASAAGSQFKCPTCGDNSATFIQAIQRRGVYVPGMEFTACEPEPSGLNHSSECQLLEESIPTVELSSEVEEEVERLALIATVMKQVVEEFALADLIDRTVRLVERGLVEPPEDLEAEWELLAQKASIVRLEVEELNADQQRVAEPPVTQKRRREE